MGRPLLLTDEVADLIFSEMVGKELSLGMAVASLRAAGKIGVSVSTVEGWRSQGAEPGAAEVFRRFRERHDDARSEALLGVYRRLEALNRQSPIAAKELRAIKSTMFSELNERHVRRVEHSGGVRFERVVVHPGDELPDPDDDGSAAEA